jgi:hypothetical protein
MNFMLNVIRGITLASFDKLLKVSNPTCYSLRLPSK